jgi:hypothetical protein
LANAANRLAEFVRHIPHELQNDAETAENARECGKRKKKKEEDDHRQKREYPDVKGHADKRYINETEKNRPG